MYVKKCSQYETISYLINYLLSPKEILQMCLGRCSEMKVITSITVPCIPAPLLYRCALGLFLYSCVILCVNASVKWWIHSPNVKHFEHNLKGIRVSRVMDSSLSSLTAKTGFGGREPKNFLNKKWIWVKQIWTQISLISIKDVFEVKGSLKADKWPCNEKVFLSTCQP